MSERPLEGLMDVTLDKIKSMVDVNTIIGDMITAPDGTVIIPISKVTYGFASGGSEFPTKKVEGKELFGGGSGAAITINPLAFLTISKGEVKLLSINQYDNPTDRVVGMIPEIFDKASELFKKNKPEKSSEITEATAE
ncbi:MAG: GerW family sporulation protein [Acutalibacteraceae bacterium]